MRSNVAEGVSQAGETAKETLRSARDMNDDSLKDVERRIRGNPLLSVRRTLLTQA